MGLRVGIGTDAHRCVAGRPLILGGVHIPAEFGLEAHSDGDVVAHAVLDAMLGAAALGDKGLHFPSSDPQYEGIRSTRLLAQATQMLRERGCSVVNVDASVVCEEPKLAPFLLDMRRELAAALGISASSVSIKGTTSERLGFAGRKEGIAALAVVLVQTPDTSDER